MMGVLEKSIHLHSVQAEFFFSKAKIAAFIGGVGSGKTYVGILWALSQAIQPGSIVLVVAPTYPMLRDVDWARAIELGGIALEVHRSEMSLQVRNGGKLLFRSAVDPAHLRGLDVNAALIDEAGYCTEEVFNIVLGRIRKEPGLLRIVTTPKGRNWLYHRSGDMAVYRASTYDNRENLPPEYITILEQSYSGNFARQELYGEFVAHEGLVYWMFDRPKHVQKVSESVVDRWFMGVDEGYVNPSVVLLVGVKRDGTIHLFREWYKRGELQSAIIQVCRSWMRKELEAIVVDSSAASLIAALREANLPAVAHKTTLGEGVSGVKAGIAAIQAMLSTEHEPAKLTIDPSCVCTIAEFESYSWKPDKDQPEKQDDHAMDALRYVVDYVLAGRQRGNLLFTIGEER